MYVKLFKLLWKEKDKKWMKEERKIAKNRRKKENEWQTELKGFSVITPSFLLSAPVPQSRTN